MILVELVGIILKLELLTEGDRNSDDADDDEDLAPEGIESVAGAVGSVVGISELAAREDVADNGADEGSPLSEEALDGSTEDPWLEAGAVGKGFSFPVDNMDGLVLNGTEVRPGTENEGVISALLDPLGEDEFPPGENRLGDAKGPVESGGPGRKVGFSLRSHQHVADFHSKIRPVSTLGSQSTGLRRMRSQHFHSVWACCLQRR